MIKRQKSHISISSNECKDNSFTLTKQLNNNGNLEQYLNKLILISMRHKKFLERHDYFYSQLKRQKNNKKIKLKLTPFQKYEKYKLFAKKIKLNKNLFPLNMNYISNKNLNNNNLETMKKNNNINKAKTLENNKLCLTNYHPNNFLNNKCKAKNKTKIYISSIDKKINNINNVYSYNQTVKIKKNKYSNISYDNSNCNTMTTFKTNKICQTHRYKTAFKSKKHKIEPCLSDMSKSKRSIGIITSALKPLRIINLKSRNNRVFGLPNIQNYISKYQVPLVRMDDCNFLKDIMTSFNKIN